MPSPSTTTPNPESASDGNRLLRYFYQRAHLARRITGVRLLTLLHLELETAHLCDPKHPPITETEAEIYLARDLRTALVATLRYCPVLVTEPEGRLAAIVDFTFNLGAGRLQTSTRRRRVNQRDWDAAASELRQWVYGGGKVQPGLVARREAEASFLFCLSHLGYTGARSLDKWRGVPRYATPATAANATAVNHRPRLHPLPSWGAVKAGSFVVCANQPAINQ